ncbi:MAG: hypothetical protein ACLGHC_10075, partial [Alphaproteobacteria bacterium]
AACGIAEDRVDGYVAFAKGANLRLEDEAGSIVGLGQMQYPGRLSHLDISTAGQQSVLRSSICEIGFAATLSRVPQFLTARITFQDTSTVISHTFSARELSAPLSFDFSASRRRGP